MEGDKQTSPTGQDGKDRASDPPPIQPDVKESSYFDKIVKYVPAPIIAAYVAAMGAIQELPDNPIWLYWAIFGALLALTPLYVIYLPGSTEEGANSVRYNVLASMLAFIAWVFALGEPFAVTFDWYRPVYGSLVLIIVTLTLPVLEKIASQVRFFK